MIKHIPSILLILMPCCFIGCSQVSKKNSTPKLAREEVRELKQTEFEQFSINAAVEPVARMPQPKPEIDTSPVHESLSIWQKIKEGFTLPDTPHTSIDHELSILLNQQKSLHHQLNSALPLLAYVMREVEKRGMPSEIALIPFIESGYSLKARSSMNAKGLWQFMPATARSLELHQSWWHDDAYNAVLSTEAALDYLEIQHARFKDWMLAIAAYNSGPARLASAISKSKNTTDPHLFFSLDLPKETQKYIPKLLAYKNLINRQNQHANLFDHTDNYIQLSKLYIDQQTSLNVIASIGSVNDEHIYEYNPGFKRWATPPDKNTVLLLPWQVAFLAREKLPTLTRQERMPWDLYQIKPGDTLSEIAKKNELSTSELKNYNTLSSDKIYAGKLLKIPTR